LSSLGTTSNKLTFGGYSVDDWLQSPYRKYLPDSVLRQVLHAQLPFSQADHEDGSIVHTSSDVRVLTPEKAKGPVEAAAASHVRKALQFPSDPATRDGVTTAAETDTNDLPVLAGKSDSSEKTAQSSEPVMPSVLDQPPVQHPFHPLYGGFDNLFESHRAGSFSHCAQAFPGITPEEIQELSEKGFVYRKEHGDVMCVYCGLCNETKVSSSVAHAATSSCRFHMGFTMENVTEQQEKDIMDIYSEHQKAAKQKLNLIVKHPEYISEEARRGSFASWPELCATFFPPELMASAGFYFTGKRKTLERFCYFGNTCTLFSIFW
jgi:hypothetical protein